MRDRTFIILVAAALACLGASMVWRPGRYYVPPGRKEPDGSAEPPKSFRIAVRAVGIASMLFGAGLLVLVFWRIKA